MGWNSWDCYGAAVNEETVRANAKFMAENLKQFGWQYIVVDIQWSKEAAACVVMASGGYPVKYEKGKVITGLDENGQLPGVTVYHAGTAEKDGCLVTSGGRVLGVTALAPTLDEALQKAYDAVEKIHFDGAHYRRDIGRTR